MKQITNSTCMPFSSYKNMNNILLHHVFIISNFTHYHISVFTVIHQLFLYFIMFSLNDMKIKCYNTEYKNIYSLIEPNLVILNLNIWPYNSTEEL